MLWRRRVEWRWAWLVVGGDVGSEVIPVTLTLLFLLHIPELEIDSLV